MAETSLDVELCAVSERENNKSALVSTSFNAPTFKAFSSHHDKISTYFQAGSQCKKSTAHKGDIIKIHNGTVDTHSPILS